MPALVATLWLVNVTLDTSGQLAFKAAASEAQRSAGLARWRHMAGRPWLWLGLSAYALHLLSWIAFLSLVDLSRGMLLASINMVAIMLAGRLLFREKLTPLRVAGILLVSAGVAIVGAAG
jgi:drug/metabolite transporter (DMT)-like permease